MGKRGTTYIREKRRRVHDNTYERLREKGGKEEKDEKSLRYIYPLSSLLRTHENHV